MQMKVSQEEWNKYIERLASINEKAAELLKNYVDQYGVEDLDKLSEYAYSLTEYYGKASAAEACVMYDELAKAQGAKVKSAEPADTAPFWEVRKAVYGTQGTANTVPAVQRLVKRTASDTMLKNSIRDKAQWAWIPSGDTCAFCLTLASQGWVNASSKLLKGGHAEHIHANCNCEFAIRFDKKSTVAGYNPLKYRKIYDNAEGESSRDKINSLRRENYEKNKEKMAFENNANLLNLNNPTQNLLENISNGNISTLVNPEKQKSHLYDTHLKGKSFFLEGIQIEDVQNLIDDNVGKGIVYEKQPGKQYKEVIELEYDIGYNVDEEGNVVEKTNSFVTHYSNKRTHACPTKRSIKKDETK